MFVHLDALVDEGGDEDRAGRGAVLWIWAGAPVMASVVVASNRRAMPLAISAAVLALTTGPGVPARKLAGASQMVRVRRAAASAATIPTATMASK